MPAAVGTPARLASRARQRRADLDAGVARTVAAVRQEAAEIEAYQLAPGRATRRHYVCMTWTKGLAPWGVPTLGKTRQRSSTVQPVRWRRHQSRCGSRRLERSRTGSRSHDARRVRLQRARQPRAAIGTHGCATGSLAPARRWTIWSRQSAWVPTLAHARVVGPAHLRAPGIAAEVTPLTLLHAAGSACTSIREAPGGQATCRTSSWCTSGSSPTTGRDVEAALRAPVADPLWMLGRQWQFGEHRGEDASSPVEMRCDTSTVALRSLDRHSAGPDSPVFAIGSVVRSGGSADRSRSRELVDDGAANSTRRKRPPRGSMRSASTRRIGSRCVFRAAAALRRAFRRDRRAAPSIRPVFSPAMRSGRSADDAARSLANRSPRLRGGHWRRRRAVCASRVTTAARSTGGPAMRQRARHAETGHAFGSAEPVALSRVRRCRAIGRLKTTGAIRRAFRPTRRIGHGAVGRCRWRARAATGSPLRCRPAAPASASIVTLHGARKCAIRSTNGGHSRFRPDSVKTRRWWPNRCGRSSAHAGCRPERSCCGRPQWRRSPRRHGRKCCWAWMKMRICVGRSRPASTGSPTTRASADRRRRSRLGVCAGAELGIPPHGHPYRIEAGWTGRTPLRARPGRRSVGPCAAPPAWPAHDAAAQSIVDAGHELRPSAVPSVGVRLVRRWRLARAPTAGRCCGCRPNACR